MSKRKTKMKMKNNTKNSIKIDSYFWMSPTFTTSPKQNAVANTKTTTTTTENHIALDLKLYSLYTIL